MEAAQHKILIVDDASNWRTTLETLLKSYGFGVTVASNVFEAAAALQDGPYATAILDVRLDSFDDANHEGVSTILAAAHRQFPKMSFIVISSYYSETEVRNFIPLNVKLFFFDKAHFKVDALLKTLEQIVSESQS
jgi:DNA-binding NtrC family response regulator